VDTAQTAVDTAQATRDAAKKKLEMATTDSKLTAQTELALAEVKLSDAKQVLDRAKTTSRAVHITATAGTPITTTSPTPSTTGFGLPSWTPLPAYNIPGDKGAVLFTVNDYKDEKGKNKVKLKAAKIENEAQHPFRTVNIPLGAPILGPAHSTFKKKDEDAVFTFSQKVDDIKDQILINTGTNQVKKAPKAKLDEENFQTVTMKIKDMENGIYKLRLSYKYKEVFFGNQEVTFTVEE